MRNSFPPSVFKLRSSNLVIQSLVQFTKNGARGVLALDATGAARLVKAADTTRALAQMALAKQSTLAALASRRAKWGAEGEE